VLGEPLVGAAAGHGQPVTVLEANLDDATGDTLAHAVVQLLEAGALDAWLQPVIMKRGRPAHVLSALCDPALATGLAGVMATQTGTLGVRWSNVQRLSYHREHGTVEVEGLPVRVKVGPGRVKAEHADAARVARITGLSLIEVAARAEAGFRNASSDPDGDLNPPPPGA
jgi:uncharacterized protein (DUF111 family)